MLDDWSEETQIETSQYYRNEHLGIDPNISLTNKDYDSFEEAMKLALNKSQKYGKTMQKLRKKWGELPFFGMLDLTIMSEDIDSVVYQNMSKNFINVLLITLTSSCKSIKLKCQN